MDETIVLSPCWTGTKTWGWYPWMALVAEQLQVRFVFAEMPDPDVPEVVKWRETLSDSLRDASPEKTILVAHSLGCLNAINTLRNTEPEEKLKALIFVAPFSSELNVDVVDRFVRQSEMANLRGLPVQQSWIISSDNDPYIPDPWRNLQQLTADSEVNSIILAGRGHFSEGSGCFCIPELQHLLQAIVSHN